MPRGIPKNKMTNKQAITPPDVGDVQEVVTNEQAVVKVLEVQTIAVDPHPSNLHSFNWSITPLGDEKFNYSNNVTGFSFDGDMKRFNQVLRGK